MGGYCSEQVGGNIYTVHSGVRTCPKEITLCLQLTKPPIASFASSILSSDHSTLVTTGRVATYQDPRRIPAGFPTGGSVFHDVELLTDRTLISSKKKGNNSDKEKEKDLPMRLRLLTSLHRPAHSSLTLGCCQYPRFQDTIPTLPGPRGRGDSANTRY